MKMIYTEKYHRHYSERQDWNILEVGLINKLDFNDWFYSVYLVCSVCSSMHV